MSELSTGGQDPHQHSVHVPASSATAEGTAVQRAFFARRTAAADFVQQAWAEAHGWLQQHPRMAVAGVAGSLLLGAGAAFAVATPPGDGLAVRQVTEVVEPASSYAHQEAQLQDQPLILYRHTETRDSDTAHSLLARMGVNDWAAETYIRKTDVVRTEVLGLKKRYVQAEVGADKRLKRLSVIWLNPEQPRQYKKLVLTPGGDGFSHEFNTGDAEVTAAFAGATIAGTYYHATRKAGIPVEVANQVLDIFEPVADLNAQVRKGDHITVVYERLSINGLELGAGRVLSASVQAQGKPYQAVWFAGGKNAGGRYYTPAGEGLSLAYIQPVPGATVTSGFEPYRIHPVFGDVRAHTGVDFAAPTGTPILSVADGAVSFAGQQTGYGNVVVVQHGGKQSTLYAHMSHIDVRVGEKVSQGQVIGKVGSTGWSTGPHLHFETRDKDVPQDPEVVLAERKSAGVPADQRAAFRTEVAAAQHAWGQVQNVQMASAN